MEQGDPAVVAGRYEVVRALGRGGMGKVFLVVDKTNGQRLAMKVLRSQFQQNDHILKRFEREIEASRRLNHPSIVKIFDAGRDNDMVYYTMEYLEGRSLRDWVKRRGCLEFPSAVRVLCLMARALQHAHKITIHRDISPDNVMVMRDGTIRLLDFGLAKLEDNNEGLTMISTNMGKIQYNAPEQRRNAAAVDHRADIYPLGIMFFEMLVGCRPKPGMVLTEQCPDLPPGSDEFLEKALAENPDDRFQTAKEFEDALIVLFERHKRGERAADAQKGGALAKLNPLNWLKALFGKKKA